MQATLDGVTCRGIAEKGLYHYEMEAGGSRVTFARDSLGLHKHACAARGLRSLGGLRMVRFFWQPQWQS